jgi:hypothetical protein
MATARGEMEAVAAKGASSFDQLASVGKVALEATAVAAIAVGTVSVAAATQFESAHARMVQAVVDTGASFDTLAPKIKVQQDQFEKLGFTQAQYESSLGRMTAAFGNADKAMAAMNTTADVARAMHKSLEETVVLVAKAAEGNAMSLKRLGIDIELTGTKAQKSAELMALLNDRFGGQAQSYMGTFSGKLQELHVQLNDLATRIGEALIPLIERLGTDVAGVVNWFDKHKEAAIALAAAIGGPLIVAMSAYIAKQTVAFAEGVINTVKGIAAAISSVLLPATEAEAGALTVAATAESILTFGLAALAGAAAIATVAVLSHGSAADNTAAAVNTYGEANRNAAAAAELSAGAANDAADATAHQLKSVDDLIAVLDRGIAAHEAYKNAEQAATKAGEAHAKAVRDLADLLKAGPVDLAKVASATDALANARTTETRATEEQTKAQAKLDDLLKPQNPDAVAAATDKLGAATDGVVRSNLNLIDAQKKLNDLLHPETSDKYAAALAKVHEAQSAMLLAQASGNQAAILTATKDLTKAQDDLAVASSPASAEDLTKAQLDVDDANRAVHQSTRDVTQATSDLEDANRPTIGTATAIAAARQTVADKTMAVDSAHRATAASQGILTAAMAGDPDFQQKVADKRQGVADSTQHQSDAQENVTRTGIAYKTSMDTVNADLAANPGLIQGAIDKLNALAATNPDIKSPLLKAMTGQLTTALNSANLSINAQIKAITITGDALKGLQHDVGNILTGTVSAAPQHPQDGWSSSVTFVGGAAEGAVVKAKPGGTLMVVGEGGKDEVIAPLPDGYSPIIPGAGGGGGSVTISVGQIVIQESTSASDTAREVREILLRMGRGTVNVGLG